MSEQYGGLYDMLVHLLHGHTSDGMRAHTIARRLDNQFTLVPKWEPQPGDSPTMTAWRQRYAPHETTPALSRMYQNAQFIKNHGTIRVSYAPDKSHSATSPWSVGPVPEDDRTTYWKTWGEAMHWATCPAYRAKELADEQAEAGASY